MSRNLSTYSRFITNNTGIAEAVMGHINTFQDVCDANIVTPKSKLLRILIDLIKDVDLSSFIDNVVFIIADTLNKQELVNFIESTFDIDHYRYMSDKTIIKIIGKISNKNLCEFINIYQFAKTLREGKVEYIEENLKRMNDEYDLSNKKEVQIVLNFLEGAPMEIKGFTSRISNYILQVMTQDELIKFIAYRKENEKDRANDNITVFHSFLIELFKDVENILARLSKADLLFFISIFEEGARDFLAIPVEVGEYADQAEYDQELNEYIVDFFLEKVVD